eukprot:m.111799 g.111799  ORF g.111799 m.111799 type:complete len:66 (-) comp13462_c0_seq1:1384-1581(-)
MRQKTYSSPRSKPQTKAVLQCYNCVTTDSFSAGVAIYIYVLAFDDPTQYEKTCVCVGASMGSKID